MSSTTTPPAIPAEPARRAKIYRAPEPITSVLGPSVFFAGFNEPGFDERSHLDMTRRLEELPIPITIFDPRRGDRDDSWVECLSDERYRKQMEWEHDNLERADIAAIYFAPGSEAPDAFLQLGLTIKKAIVCCPEGFDLDLKKTLRAVCARCQVPFVETVEELVNHIIAKLG